MIFLITFVAAAAVSVDNPGISEASSAHLLPQQTVIRTVLMAAHQVSHLDSVTSGHQAVPDHGDPLPRAVFTRWRHR